MSKTRMGKRAASLLLSLVMMLSLLPTTVYAAGADEAVPNDAEEVIAPAANTTEDADAPSASDSEDDKASDIESAGVSEQGSDAANTTGDESSNGADAAVSQDSAVAPQAGETGLSAVYSSEAPDVAKIGEVGYTTLEDAVAAAGENDTITLVDDITVTDTLTISKAVTLDLAGRTISGAVAPLVTIGTSGDLTINDSTGGGEISNAAAGTVLYLALGSKGTVTLNGGTIHAASAVNGAIEAYVSSYATVNINGGAVIADTGNAIKIGANSGATLNVTGGSVKGEQYGIYLYGNGTVKVTDGRITGGTYAVYASSGRNKIITLAGGTFNGGIYVGFGSGSILTIGKEGGTANDVVLSSVNLYDKDHTVYLYSGTVKEFENWTSMNVADVGTGGKFLTGTKISEKLPNNLQCKENDDGTYFYVTDSTVTNAAATITRNGAQLPYNTVEQAVKDLADGDTLTLNENYTVSGSKTSASAISVQEKNITIDLGGHTVTLDTWGGNAINIAQSTTETNTVTVKNGSIVANGQGASAIFAEMDNAGTNTLTLVLQDLMINSDAERYGKVRLGTGARIEDTESNRTYITKGGLQVDGWIYGTTDTAFAHANGSTVALLNDWYYDNDAEGAVRVPEDASYGSAVLDLGGHEISYYMFNAAVQLGEYASTAKDGISRTLTISNGTISSKGIVGGAACAFVGGSDKTLILNGVTMRTMSDTRFGIVTNGETRNNTITLTNSVVEAPNSTGIYFPGDGTLTVTDSRITGNFSGIEIRGGELNVSGDKTEITATCSEFKFTNNTSGTTTDGAAIAAVKHGVGNDLTVNITGGTMRGVKALYQADPNADQAGSVTMSVTGGTFRGEVTAETTTKFISGGTFSTAPAAAYLADGCTAKDNGDGTQDVVDNSVASVGGVKYATLPDAIKAAKSGETITLLQDVDLGTGTVNFYNSNTTDLTFDLGGHTITSAYRKGTTVQASKAGLVIKNGTIENTSKEASYKTAGTIKVVGAGTTTLKDVKITSASGSGVFVQLTSGEATISVEDHTVISGKYGVYLADPQNKNSSKSGIETLNISGGQISGTATGVYAANGGSGYKNTSVNVHITAGTVHGVTVYSSKADRMAQLTVSGGTIEGALQSNGVGGKTTITAGTFKGTLSNRGSGSITVSGGTFTEPVDQTYCADGFIPTRKADGSYGVTEGTYVVAIGEAKYATLAEAFANAKDGETIKLLTNCSGDGIMVAANRFPTGLTVDFNSFTYTVKGKLVGSTGTASNGFQLKEGNKITFRNGAVYGDISEAGDEQTDWSGAPAILIQNYCDLTLENMNIQGGNETVYTMSNNCGNVVIKDSTITAGKASGKGYDPIALDVCGYGDYTGVSVTVTDSTITGDIEISRSSGNTADMALALESGTVTGTLKVADSIRNGRTVTVTKGADVSLAQPEDYIWKDGTTLVRGVAEYNGTKYETLQAAIAAAESGTVRLLTDIAQDSSLVINKNITLDLNGKTVTNSADPMLTVKSSANAAVKNGVIETAANAGAVRAGENSRLILEGVTITGKATTKDCPLLSIEDDAEVTVAGGSTLSVQASLTGTTQPAIFIGSNNAADTPVVNIYGRVEGTPGHYLISGNGSYPATTYINIYDGAVVKSEKLAMYLPQPCVVNITGGTVEGYCGIGIKSGTLNISGGQVLGTANDSDLSDEDSRGDCMVNDGSAIVIDSNTGCTGDVNISISGSARIQSRFSTGIREIGNDAAATNVTALHITGGTVLSGSGMAAVQVRDVTAEKVSITGGSFSTDVSGYCAADYQCNAPTGEEPLYTVTKVEEIKLRRTLTIASDLIMTYTAEIPDKYQSPYAEFNFWNCDDNDWQNSRVDGVYEDGKYTFAFTGINPQRMNDTLKVTLYAATEDNKTPEAITAERTDSVAAYCTALMNSSYNAENAWTELISDLVAYGTASQKYMKYNLSTLVEDSVPNVQPVSHKEKIGDITAVSGVSKTEGGITIESVGMVLSSSYAVRVYFTLGDAEKERVAFTVKVENGAVEQTFTAGDFTQVKDDLYYFEYTGLNARQLDSRISVASTVNGAADDALEYSANTYLAYYLSSPSANTKWNDLAETLFSFGWICNGFKG